MNKLIAICAICAISTGCSNTVYTASFEFAKKRCEKNAGLKVIHTANNKEYVTSTCNDGAVFQDIGVPYK